MRVPRRSSYVSCCLSVCTAGLLGTLAACLGPPEPGLGRITRETETRLREQQQRADIAAIERADESASASGASVRMQHKALDMTLGWVSQNPSAPQKQSLVQRVAPIATALAMTASACDAAADLVRLLELEPNFDRDGKVFPRLGQSCLSPRVAVSVAHQLSKADRCAESIETIRAVWPRSHQTDWMALLSEIDTCSSVVSLERNLAFVPQDIRTTYLADRERQRQLAAERAAEEHRMALQRQAEEHKAALDADAENRRAANIRAEADRERRFQAEQQAAAIEQQNHQQRRSENFCVKDCDNAAASCQDNCRSERCLNQCITDGYNCRARCRR